MHTVCVVQEVLDQRAHMQFAVQLSEIQDPRKPVLVQQNKVRSVYVTLSVLCVCVCVCLRSLNVHSELFVIGGVFRLFVRWNVRSTTPKD